MNKNQMRYGKIGAMLGVALAASAAFAEFSADTLAFYPFNEGTAGTSADGVTLINAASAGTYDATGATFKHWSATANGVLTFDADVPGAYLFDDVARTVPQPVCSDLRSLRLTTDLTDSSSATSYDRYSGGYISIPAEVAQELSKCGTSGFTMEFFFKIPADELLPMSWSSGLTLDVGITKGSASKMISVAFPQTTTESSSDRSKYMALFLSDAAWGNYATHPYSLDNGEWHHLALTFTNGTFKVTGDYQYSATQTGLTVSEIATASAIKLGFYHNGAYVGFHGKIAGLRFSSTALGADRFLRASQYPHYYKMREPSDPIAMGGETIAYYTFREAEGHVGESAQGIRILNDIDANTHCGLITTQTTGGDVVYDDDRPAKYVFDSFKAGATACFTNPYSLKFVRSLESGSIYSADVKFQDIATELSKSDERTIEFFYKLTEEQIVPAYSYNQALTFVSGLTNCANGKAISMGLWLPCGGNGGVPKQVRFSEKGVPTNYSIVYDYPNSLCDGKWHHIAISGVATNYTMYLDYGVVMSNVVNNGAAQVLTSSEPLDFALDYFAGKISCLRVSKKALTTDEMLHLSTLDTCKPGDILWYRFEDGTVDAEVKSGGAKNTPRFYSDYAPSIFHWANEATSGDGYTSGVGYPTFSNRTRWTAVIPTTNEAERVNEKSVHFVTVPKASSGVTFATGNYIRQAVETSAGSRTMEALVKFDYTAFMEHIGSQFSETRDRVSIMSHNLGSSIGWKLYMLDVTRASAALRLDFFYEDGADFMLSYPLPEPTSIRGRWHHYAVVYDRENLKLLLYMDYEKVIEKNLDMPLRTTGASSYYEIGWGGNNQPFDGWMDEVRLSEGALTPDQFLRATGQPGLFMFVR